MQRMNIAIIGPPSFLSETIAAAWRLAGIQLFGPYSPEELLIASQLVQFDGAVIDIRYPADIMIAVTDQLDLLGVPALFADARPVSAENGGFSFSGDTASIDAIVKSLLGVEGMLRH